MTNELAATLLGVAKPPKQLARLVKKKAYIPAFEDPRIELRQLVKMHSKYTRDGTRVMAMQAHKKNRATGKVIKSMLPQEARVEYELFVDEVIKPKILKLKEQMQFTLEGFPIYKLWLEKVFGVGVVSSGYLCALVNTNDYWFGVTDAKGPRIMSVDHAKELKASRIFASSLEHAQALSAARGLRVASDQYALKSSAVRRFCGLSVVNGKAERRTSGVKSAYSQEMKTALYLMFVAMCKNLNRGIKAAKEGKPTNTPFGSTSKYYQIYVNNKKRALAAGNKKGFADSYGRRKSLDVFVEDFYIISRAIDGLPVWPSYYSAKLGFAHNGKIEIGAPKLLSVEDALNLIGYVGSTVLKAPIGDDITEMEPSDGDGSPEGDEEQEMVFDLVNEFEPVGVEDVLSIGM